MPTVSHNGTTKNKPRLDHDGYSYIMDRSTDDKTYWRCIKYFSDRCRSRLHTCVLAHTIVKPPSEHTCKFDGTSIERRIFNVYILDRAVNTQEIPDTIVVNGYKGRGRIIFVCLWNLFWIPIDLSDPSIARLPPTYRRCLSVLTSYSLALLTEVDRWGSQHSCRYSADLCWRTDEEEENEWALWKASPQSRC